MNPIVQHEILLIFLALIHRSSRWSVTTVASICTACDYSVLHMEASGKHQEVPW